MKRRFPFEEECVIALLKVVLSPNRNTSIVSLAVHFPMLVKEENLDTLEDEWQFFVCQGNCAKPHSYSYIILE